MRKSYRSHYTKETPKPHVVVARTSLRVVTRTCVVVATRTSVVVVIRTGVVVVTLTGDFNLGTITCS